MYLIDSHCHFDLMDLTQRPGGITDVIACAEAADVRGFLCVCVELDAFEKMAALTEPFEQVALSAGLHPAHVCEAGLDPADLMRLAALPRVVALGETGLDYHHKDVLATEQQQRFRTHIQVAKSVKKPLIVHTRDAREDTLRLLQEEGAETVGGVLHCFTENWAMAKAACDMGFYISFSGILTFKNAKEIQAVAQRLPLERILIETDSPYLAPVPHRGKPNEPAFVRHVAEYLASLRGVSLERIAEQTTHNYQALFGSACAETR